MRPPTPHRAGQLIPFSELILEVFPRVPQQRDCFLQTTPMSESAGCFDFLRGRRSINKRDQVVAPLEGRQSPRHHGGGELVGKLTCAVGSFDPCLL